MTLSAFFAAGNAMYDNVSICNRPGEWVILANRHKARFNPAHGFGGVSERILWGECNWV